MKNNIIHFSVVILNSAISFATNITLAKSFTVEDYGFLSSTLAVSSMVGAVVAMEVDKNSGKMAAIKPAKDVYVLFSRLRLVTLLLALIFILSYKLIDENATFERPFYWFLLLSGAVSGLNIAYFLEMTGKYHVYVVAILAEKIILLTAIGGLLWQGLLTETTYAAAYLVIISTAIVLQNIFVSKTCKVKLVDIFSSGADLYVYCKKSIYENISLVFLVFIQSGFTGWSRVVYGNIYGFESVGYFSVALQFVVLYSLFLGNFERIWRPIIYKDLIKNDFHSALKYASYSILYILVVSCVLYLLIDEIISAIYDRKYTEVAYYFLFLVIQSFAILMNSLSIIFTVAFKKSLILLILSCVAILFIMVVLPLFEFVNFHIFVIMIPVTQIIASLLAILYSLKNK